MRNFIFIVCFMVIVTAVGGTMMMTIVDQYAQATNVTGDVMWLVPHAYGLSFGLSCIGLMLWHIYEADKKACEESYTPR